MDSTEKKLKYQYDSKSLSNFQSQRKLDQVKGSSLNKRDSNAPQLPNSSRVFYRRTAQGDCNPVALQADQNQFVFNFSNPNLNPDIVTNSIETPFQLESHDVSAIQGKQFYPTQQTESPLSALRTKSKERTRCIEYEQLSQQQVQQRRHSSLSNDLPFKSPILAPKAE